MLAIRFVVFRLVALIVEKKPLVTFTLDSCNEPLNLIEPAFIFRLSVADSVTSVRFWVI